MAVNRALSSELAPKMAKGHCAAGELVNARLNQTLACMPQAGAVKCFLEKKVAFTNFADFQLERARIERPALTTLRLLYRATLKSETPQTRYYFLRAHASEAAQSPSLGLSIRQFPEDSKLTTLPQAADGRTLAALFNRLFAPRAAALDRVDVAMIQYEPEKKCLFRYRLRWRNDFEGQPLPQILYGKVSAKYRRAHDHLTRIHGAQPQAGLRLPEAVGIDADLSLQLCGELPGVRLSEHPLQEAAVYGAVGRGLAAFHALPIELAARRSWLSELNEMAQWFGEFASAVPGAAARIDALQGNINGVLRRRADAVLAPVHGDFNAANLLIAAGERPGLLDFDDCSMGWPEQDLGSFFAELKLLALRQFADPARLDFELKAFLHAYLGARGDRDADLLAAHCALGCLRCAYFQCLLRPTRVSAVADGLAMLEVAEDAVKRGVC